MRVTRVSCIEASMFNYNVFWISGNCGHPGGENLGFVVVYQKVIRVFPGFLIQPMGKMTPLEGVD